MLTCALQQAAEQTVVYMTSWRSCDVTVMYQMAALKRLLWWVLDLCLSLCTDDIVEDIFHLSVAMFAY